MRKMLLAVVAFFTMATTASAQFVQSNASAPASSGNIFASMPTDGYNRVYFSYNPVSASWSESASSNKKIIPLNHGLTLGYLRGSNIIKSLPLFVEYGANFQWLFGDSKVPYYDEYGDEFKGNNNLNMFSINIPVNVALRLSFMNNELSVTPYLGLNGRINLGGFMKMPVAKEDDETISCKYDLFSDEDEIEEVDENEFSTGMGDGALKRFQIGFNCGVTLSYKAYSIGIGYVADFNNIVDPDVDDPVTAKLGVTTISVGYNF